MGGFPSINQFRNVVKVHRETAEYHGDKPPVRKYRGTVKIHGTNAAIHLERGELTYHSRTSELTIGKGDNYGFMGAMLPHEADIILAMSDIGEEVTIYGEWCGKGIQAGVAVAELPKMLVVFAVRANDEWLPVETFVPAGDGPIVNIAQFPSFDIEIDFNNPELSQNVLGEITAQVEAECPIGKHYGVSGVGEGVVWRPADGDQSSKFWFKVKGEKHSVTRVKTLAPVDVERFAARSELISAIVTDNRCQQMLDQMVGSGTDLDIRNMGTYLRMVFADVAKEETDTVSASGFQIKELGKPISEIAKRFFMNRLVA